MKLKKQEGEILKESRDTSLLYLAKEWHQCLRHPGHGLGYAGQCQQKVFDGLPSRHVPHGVQHPNNLKVEVDII